ncbi:hypothetical protein GLW08_16425 [Pontibacillus yanchengensis]|uniref:Uncharacterized protein n=1 Tax=Pontibacillus yanchengensis TaxID=462910 RepID=A0ACC7VIZ4_9BACI|nr:hypothetical protein [Pontibacillus yanchengensis]MYL54921.1 hypothetical protein [Pontibacillus yanchengensis]
MKKNPESFSNSLLYFSLGCIILAFIFSGVFQSKESESLQEKLTVSTQVRSLLNNDSKGIENKLNTIVENTNQISKIEIYNVSGISESIKVFDYVKKEKPNFEYSRDFAFTPLFVDFHPSGSGDSNWYVITERRSFHTLSVLVLLLGFTLYWFSFSIWALRNAYYQKRLNVMWAFLLVLLNVIGYSLFLLYRNKTDAKHGF